MKRIKGFDPARVFLERKVHLVPTVSPRLSEHLMEMFGIGDPVGVVDKIVNDVSARGDSAVRDYSHLIDGVELESLEVPRTLVATAYTKVNPELVSSLTIAKERILSFHQTQKESLWQGHALLEGCTLARPLERVGLYAPGGRASYPSTVLMTALPAQAAGVGEIILCTPPDREGMVPWATLVAADLAGVDRIFAIGGAQAIAAMAYGTQTVPQVDKICGPGNIFVMLAKKAVYGIVNIDGLQGPSEVLIVADTSARPSYCAIEMLAQAEHDPMASAVLITNSTALADQVESKLEELTATLERHSIVADSLENHGAIVVVDSLDEAIKLANYYAPEHLCLFTKDAPSHLDQVKNAGCVFLGEMATVAFGDYISGPSHVLPTGGTARFASPLGVYDFIKHTSLISVGREDILQLGQHVVNLAQAEGLDAHARAVKLRLEDI